MDDGIGERRGSRFFVVSRCINHVLNFGDLDIMAIGELLKFGCPFEDICGHSIVQLGLFLLFKPGCQLARSFFCVCQLPSSSCVG